MIKLPEELNNLKENDNVIYHFTGDMDFTEYLIALSQTPHWDCLRREFSLIELKERHKWNKSFRFEGRYDFGTADKAHYQASRYTGYKQITIGEQNND